MNKQKEKQTKRSARKKIPNRDFEGENQSSDEEITVKNILKDAELLEMDNITEVIEDFKK